MANEETKSRRKQCVIVGAVPCDLGGLKVGAEDLVIGADAGWEQLTAAGLPVHFAVGDWDSGEMPPAGDVRTVPTEKDDTDMMLAVKEGLSRGYRDFRIYGGMGGERTDHTLANLSTLLYLTEHGARGVLYGEREAITAIRDGSLTFTAPQGRLSVFAAGEAKGVTLRGVQYPLRDACLSPSFPLGVSNEFREKEALVAVNEGTLFIVTSKEVMV